MKTIKVIIYLLALLLFASCQIAPTATPTPIPPTSTPIPPTPPTPKTPSTGDLRTAKPRYAADGPFQVARRDFLVTDTEEVLKIYLFYPVQKGAPDAAHGPYPLVIFSPGLASNSGVGTAMAPLLTPIASYGFVAITYDTRGESEEKYWPGAAYRPLDFQRIIDFSKELTAQGGKLAGMIDTNRIAATGISSGGWTALMAGGAQMDLGWCAAHPDLAKREPFNCLQFVPHKEEIASMLGLESAPSGLWPQRYDPHVIAMIAISPDGDIWGEEFGGVASLKVPAMVMGGTADKLNLPELCAYPIFEHLGSKDKTLVMLEGAKHGLSWDTYSDDIIHIMVAFLLAKVKDDPQAAQALLPENMNFPGVKYQTTFSGSQ